VVIGLPDGNMYWEGDFMTDFPFFRELSKTDQEAWNTWLQREDVGEFLDHGIAQCVEQYIANQQAQGYVVTKASENGEYQQKEIIEPDPEFHKQ